MIHFHLPPSWTLSNHKQMVVQKTNSEKLYPKHFLKNFIQDSSASSISFLSWYNRMIHSVWQECESLLPCQTDIFLQQTSLLRGCLFCNLFCACQRNLTHFTTNIVELQREGKKKHAFPVIQASMKFQKFN